MEKILYQINWLLFNTIFDELARLTNKSKTKINIFDIGSYKGNFSRELKKKLNKKANFYLFEPNNSINIKDFKYYPIGISDRIGYKKYYFNNLMPSSGSGFEKIIKKDRLWNITRKLLTLRKNNKYTAHKVETNTVDNFCKKNSIKKIELLKIDTEGHEFNVLNGSKKMLKNCSIIYMEVLETKKKFNKKLKKINSFLNKYNFRLIKLKKIWSTSLLSNVNAADALYIKDK